jgi:hypothetical protein
MPTVTRTYLRTSLVFLAAGLSLGLLRAVPSESLTLALSGSTAVYYHLLVVGWLTQLVFGVAQWMFPRARRGRHPRSDSLAWSTYGLLNAGLVIRALAEPSVTTGDGGPWGAVLALSALLQWLAVVLFIIDIWPRVRGR